LLALSDGPTFDFGTHANGSSTTHTFTVINVGGLAGTGIAPVALGAPFGFAGGAYPGSGGSCSSLLPPGTSCTVTIAFAPTSSSAVSGELQLGYDDGAAAEVARVGVTGT